MTHLITGMPQPFVFFWWCLTAVSAMGQFAVAGIMLLVMDLGFGRMPGAAGRGRKSRGISSVVDFIGVAVMFVLITTMKDPADYSPKFFFEADPNCKPNLEFHLRRRGQTQF